MKTLQTSLTYWTALMAAACLGVSCGGQEPGWAGSVTEEAGLTVVRNPSEPLRGQITFELEEELRLGNGQDENLSFHNVRDIGLDGESNIYVLDSGNYRVQVFEADGTYRRTVGKEGQGPGEFTDPFGIFLDETNNLYVSDGRKVHRFDPSGDYETSTPVDDAFRELCVDSEGNLLVTASPEDASGRKQVLRKITPSGESLRTFAEYSDTETVRKKIEGQTWSFRVSHDYTPKLYLTSLGSRTFLYAYSQEYMLYIFSEEGAVRTRIEKEEEPSSISGRDKALFIESMEKGMAQRGMKFPPGVMEQACDFPPFRPFFRKVLIDDNGRIFLQKPKSSLMAQDEDVMFDVFDASGRFIYRVVTSVEAEIISQGVLYETHEDEETGEISIRRFKILNWNALKS